MRAARYQDEIDNEIGRINRRHTEACEQIHTPLLQVASMEYRVDVLLDRRLALLADADR